MLKAEGRALTITDARMTRFWITLDQSVQLVVNALGISDRGFHSKILVPIIPSIKIVDLAKAIDPETPFRVSGVRPGEKIHETLITEDEGRATTIQVGLDGKNFYVINEQGYIPRHHEPLAGPMPYTSDGNLQWLSLADLKTMVA
jgi:UDP-N-acetylglucosamine 4,6-dehydratase